MITSAIQQIVNTDRTELKDFFSEVDKLHKTDEAVTAKIANNPALAKALTDPNLTPTQKQQLATELVSSVMVELGYTQAVDVTLVADSQDNRKGHYGEDNNIYLNDANLNNTKDLATTLGHETSHAIDNQDPSIDTNPQNNTSKADNEIYAQNYGDDFSDYVEFASENYGDGSLADTNNNNLGNTPAERQRNQKLVDNNNQDYDGIDKSKGEDLCSGTNCYGKATQKRLEESPVNPNTVVTIVNKKNSNSNYGNYQVRMMQDKNGKPIGYSAYNPNTGNNILMKRRAKVSSSTTLFQFEHLNQ
ncbi:hypothetical protein BSPWISOXPB_9982 [uncultured Gammaproteobacteria bacterium]|nr:hypothetical protein BSPWISOXPB_9982 [uncultured Gammaproteobacteria bacterium]